MRKRTAVVDPSGLVQVVHLHWDKSARGGQGARDRSAVAQAFAIPADDLAGAGGYLCIAESRWNERNAFAAPASERHHRIPLADGYTFGCVRVSTHPGGLQIRYQYDRLNGGAPDQWSFSVLSGYGESPGRSLVVVPGQWARVCYNGRFSDLDTGNWWYEQTTVNVAWFGGEPDHRVFLDREPAEEIRGLADLW